MVDEKSNLWELARGGQAIDANALASAIAAEAATETADFRTELLLRDSLTALFGHWGALRGEQWLAGQPTSARLREIRGMQLGPAGFPSLISRIMDTTKPETILAFFRELGIRVARPARLNVGGSTSLVLGGLLSRQTDDVDVVDEVPPDIRDQHEMLSELASAYGLSLTHFQSHYLPDGWQHRVRSLGQYGQLNIFLVDIYDVLASKLTSARRKDRDDLRAASGLVDKNRLAERLTSSGQTLLADAKSAENARSNWYIVYGETLAV